jgi:hypothetical protein
MLTAKLLELCSCVQGDRDDVPGFCQHARIDEARHLAGRSIKTAVVKQFAIASCWDQQEYPQPPSQFYQGACGYVVTWPGWPIRTWQDLAQQPTACAFPVTPLNPKLLEFLISDTGATRSVSLALCGDQLLKDLINQGRFHPGPPTTDTHPSFQEIQQDQINPIIGDLMIR